MASTTTTDRTGAVFASDAPDMAPLLRLFGVLTVSIVAVAGYRGHTSLGDVDKARVMARSFDKHGAAAAHGFHRTANILGEHFSRFPNQAFHSSNSALALSPSMRIFSRSDLDDPRARVRAKSRWCPRSCAV